MNDIQFFLEVWRQTSEKSSAWKSPGETRACNHVLLPLTPTLTVFWSKTFWQRNWRVFIVLLLLRLLKINQHFFPVTYCAFEIIWEWKHWNAPFRRLTPDCRPHLRADRTVDILKVLRKEYNSACPLSLKALKLLMWFHELICIDTFILIHQRARFIIAVVPTQNLLE